MIARRKEIKPTIKSRWPEAPEVSNGVAGMMRRPETAAEEAMCDREIRRVASALKERFFRAPPEVPCEVRTVSTEYVPSLLREKLESRL